MAGEAKQVGIKNSWSLIAFAKAHGRMQVGTFESNGEQFKSCIFTNPEDQSRCFVGFSSNLGEMTPAEIAADKDNLQVVQLESDNYYLCHNGANAWQDVNLGF